MEIHPVDDLVNPHISLNDGVEGQRSGAFRHGHGSEMGEPTGPMIVACQWNCRWSRLALSKGYHAELVTAECVDAQDPLGRKVVD